MMTVKRRTASSPSVRADELQDVLEIRRALRGPVSTTGKGCSRFAGSSRMPEQVQDLLGRARAAGKHDDAVRQAHERLEALLDVRHDHELVDDRVGRLGGDDAGLGDADVAAVLDALLGMADGGALHRALHGARAAAGADVQAAQAHLVADVLRVLVLVGADRVAAPAHHEIRPRLVVQHARVAQDVEHRVGDGRRVGRDRTGRCR